MSQPLIKADSAESFDAVVGRMLPLERLEREKDRLRAAYLSAKPYPHLIIDGLWDPEILDRIIAEFPRRGQRDWVSHDTPREWKEGSRGLLGLSPFSKLFLMELCSPEFLRALGAVTGHEDLVADPLFHGGGLHEYFRGGWLNLHVDWRKHPALPLTRRLNMIIYLNRDWDPAWGGAIELCDPDSPEAGAKTDCLFNRTLIFPTTDESFHGVTTPISCPEHRTRQSISLFYWTEDQEALKTAKTISFLPGKRRTWLQAALRALVPPIILLAQRQLAKALAPKT